MSDHPQRLFGPPPRPTVSAAIITLNAAATLPRTLQRLAWADEIVVVDSFSRDSTASLARKFGAKLLARQFDNFAAQRNFALAHTRCDWVLFVDADEWPSPALEREILRTLSRTRCHGLRVPIRSTIFGRRFRFSGTQDDCPVRLVRRGQGMWMGDVHERLVCRGNRIGRLRHTLHHETLPDRAAFMEKMHRYTSLEAAERIARRQWPRWPGRWWQAAREAARRLIYRHGWLDGPEGWAFCLLSGLSQWELGRAHRRLWHAEQEAGLQRADDGAAGQRRRAA